MDHLEHEFPMKLFRSIKKANSPSQYKLHGLYCLKIIVDAY